MLSVTGPADSPRLLFMFLKCLERLKLMISLHKRATLNKIPSNISTMMFIWNIIIDSSDKVTLRYKRISNAFFNSELSELHIGDNMH